MADAPRRGTRTEGVGSAGSERTDHRIEVGYVARAHGIRGEIAAVPHDPESTTLCDVEAVWIRGQRVEVLSARHTDKGFLMKLAGVLDRNAAEALRGASVEVDRAEIPMEDGDIFIADLVGCEARLPDGTPYGTIVRLELGPQVRLVIHHGAVERLLPLVDELVPAIDLGARVVTVDPPEGLPEDPIS